MTISFSTSRGLATIREWRLIEQILYNKILVSFLFGIDAQVFISVSKDSPDALTEARGLYDELKAKGCNPWMDEKELQFGDILAEKIFWAIRQSDVIIPIMTGGYAKSLSCLRELYYAVVQIDPKRKTIIPILLEDEANIGYQKAGKWLLRIRDGRKCFKLEEKAAMIKFLKEKVFLYLLIN